MKRPFGSVIMTRLNFKVKRMFLLRNWGHVLTPDFSTCQGRVSQRRKGSASYDRWIWGDDRVPWSKILLTEEEEVDQICRLRFGKSYLIFRIVFIS